MRDVPTGHACAESLDLAIVRKNTDIAGAEPAFLQAFMGGFAILLNLSAEHHKTVTARAVWPLDSMLFHRVFHSLVENLQRLGNAKLVHSNTAESHA